LREEGQILGTVGAGISWEAALRGLSGVPPSGTFPTRSADGPGAFAMKKGGAMPKGVAYEEAGPEVRAVYDDIMATRKTDWVNNFWKALAGDPVTLKRTWESIKQVLAPGSLDALTKEMIYLAVSASNQCPYCIASHTVAARKAGMSDAMFAELMAVVGMANETNRLASGYQVETDPQFKS